MTVFHELLNKRGKTFRIRFGPLIPPERFADGDPAEVTPAPAGACGGAARGGQRRGVLTPLPCSPRPSIHRLQHPAIDEIGRADRVGRLVGAEEDEEMRQLLGVAKRLIAACSSATPCR